MKMCYTSEIISGLDGHIMILINLEFEQVR